MTEFNQGFYNISGEIVDLKLIDTYEGRDGALPFYWWDIILKSENVKIGKISLRIGQNYHSYYNGNVGYEIDETYRGKNYSLLACQLILQVAKYHNMDKIYFSCNYDNIASYKIIQKFGAKLVEEVVPPKDYIFYFDGIKKHKIYEFVL